MSTDRVTVVVMTRNRWSDLSRTLPRHRAPVVVVDNGSDDRTPERVRETFPKVEVVALGTNLGAPARNLGVERAGTPYVAFADDDSWWAEGALERAAEILDEHPRLGLLAARLLVSPGDGPDPVCAAMADSPLGTEPDLPGPSILGFVACATVVRRDAFLEAGGFDDVVFFMGEEERVALDLAAAGWALTYCEEVVAHHQPSEARDRQARVARARRNELLTALMRRPWRVVLRTLGRTVSSPVGRRAAVDALPRARAALRARRLLPAHVEQARAVLAET